MYENYLKYTKHYNVDLISSINRNPRCPVLPPVIYISTVTGSFSDPTISSVGFLIGSLYSDIVTRTGLNYGEHNTTFLYGQLSDAEGFVEHSNTSIEFFSASCDTVLIAYPPLSNTASISVSFFSASIFNVILESSASDASSLSILFESASLSNVIIESTSSNQSSIISTFNSGSFFNEIMVVDYNTEAQTTSIGFLDGLLTNI